MTTQNLIYFSPTKTTLSIVNSISINLNISVSSSYNLAHENLDVSKNIISKDTLTIIGIPVYGGRLPLVVLDQLKELRSDKSPAIIVAVYGNRHYDDALLELKHITQKCGFNIIAAATFLGEHSYSSEKNKIAHNRPDANDFELCKAFALKVKEKLSSLNTFAEITVPGNFPYKERILKPSLSPETNVEDCTLCKICMDVCPTNAISISSSVNTNQEACIWCCACVKECPTQARVFQNEVIDGIITRLTSLCQERREPEWFL